MTTETSSLLRLLFGVVLELVAVCVLTGVDVLATEMFSWSESESCKFGLTERFLLAGAINLSISFWFSANIFARSVIISFLRLVFISSRFSSSSLGFLLELGIRFSVELFSVREASKSPDANSAIAFLFWLLVVIFKVEISESLARIKFFKEILSFRNFNEQQNFETNPSSTKNTCPLYLFIPS